MNTADSLVALLSELVVIPSQTADKAASAECLDAAAGHLQSAGLHLIDFESNGYRSLLATSQLTQSPRILLQAHLDVVPAPSNCFKLIEREDALRGRGVFDMKFAAACYLQLANELSEQLNELDFGILLTTDEEVGGEDGVKHVLDQGYRTEVCVIPDGGNDWRIEKSCNGVWLFKISIDGKSAHGSRPWEGENAIMKLYALLNELQSLFGDMKPDKSTVNIGEIRGGEAINQVPGSAEALIDVRYPTQSECDRLQAEVKAIIEKHDARLKDIANTRALTIDTANPHIQKFMQLASDALGQPIEPCHSLGASDARFFNELGIATIVIRPHGGGAHGDDEWLARDEFFDFYQVLKAFVTETARVGA